MALLYPWATKEYLLWEMTIGQILFYYTVGAEIKNGTVSSSTGLNSKSPKELRAMRDEVKLTIEKEKSEAAKAQYRTKYGDI